MSKKKLEKTLSKLPHFLIKPESDYETSLTPFRDKQELERVLGEIRQEIYNLPTKNSLFSLPTYSLKIDGVDFPSSGILNIDVQEERSTLSYLSGYGTTPSKCTIIVKIQTSNIPLTQQMFDVTTIPSHHVCNLTIKTNKGLTTIDTSHTYITEFSEEIDEVGNIYKLTLRPDVWTTNHELYE